MAVRLVRWLRQHDPGYVALRRAGRSAIVMPGMFAFSVEVINNATVALFTAFGVIALLMLVEFGGAMRSRLEAQAALSIAGAVVICLGTLVSGAVWSAVLAMLIVAFVIIFLGVVSSVFAGATTALLLAFILPAATRAPASAIPERLAGWGLASGAAFLAVWLLWPAPVRTPLRTNSAARCRALATRIARDAERLENGEAPHDPSSDEPDPHDPVVAMQQQFLATPWRPTGLSASDRALVRLVDEIVWMNSIVTELDREARPSLLRGYSLAVRRASANVLSEAASLLETRAAPTAPLTTARHTLESAMSEMQGHLEHHLSMTESLPGIQSPPSPTNDHPIERFLVALDFSFRSREVGYAAERIAIDVEHAVIAARRGFFERVLGHEPGGSNPWASAKARITSHLERHSVWLHNSVRGAIGLAIAVLVAEEIAVEHSFWVILGTLSVLRSNALNTGQNALRAVLGTIVGFIVGAGLVELVGTNVTVLWFLLPLVLFVAAFVPTAISFAAGQAGFTLTLVILFNIIEPAGWRVGLVRVEDIAIGCAVSAGVALLLWPRGAAAELGTAMHDAYVTGVAFLATAASANDRPSRHGRSPVPDDEAELAAAASRRLDDAFRSYLAERGAKPVPLSDVAALVTGVAILRLSADAIVDLWSDHVGITDEWGTARHSLGDLAGGVVAWYDQLADSFEGRARQEELSPEALSDDGVVSAVRDRLAREDDVSLDEVVKILWTAGHLMVVQRLERSVIDASQVAESLWIAGRTPERGAHRRSPRALVQR
ncbi:MAG TPA: FUSC family protein [Acidimicrobiales bacterium]|nr:FUSC family protein [Acidimicrobiales bacterium]